jgi:3'-5' exoribonuclease
MTNPGQLEALQAPLGAAPTAVPLIRSFVRDLVEGDSVAAVFAVRERDRRTRRSGDDFLRLVVADKTGSVEAVCWEEIDDLFELTAPGAVLFIEGRFSIHPQYGGKITINTARVAGEDEYSHDELTEGPPVSIDELETRLRQLLETIQNPQLCELLDRVFGADSEIYQRFRVAPAAKYYHQAYVH